MLGHAESQHQRLRAKSVLHSGTTRTRHRRIRDLSFRHVIDSDHILALAVSVISMVSSFVNLASLDCGPFCMMVASSGSTYGPDLELRSYCQTVCELKTGKRSPHHTSRFLDRSARPLPTFFFLRLRRTPHRRQVIIQTLAVSNAHPRSHLHHRKTSLDVERSV